MTINRKISYLLAVGSLAWSNAGMSAACVVSGDSLKDASSEYSRSCTQPRADCDLVNGLWYCASENINQRNINTLLQFDSTEFDSTNNSNTVAEVDSAPAISDSHACVDTDGDGWGWDGTQSCRMTTTVTAVNDVVLENTAPPPTTAQCVDSDGDGWGWDGTRSCRMPVTASGFTFSLQSTVAEQSVQTVELVPQVRANDNCSGSVGPSDITDLVLVTGQSNVLGARTNVSANVDQWGRVIDFYGQDRPNSRVFAWTVDGRSNNAGTGWEVAQLSQTWHDHAPGGGALPHNNFAFHFAKKVAESSDCKVVGFIMVAEPGKGIAHWDTGATGWNEVVKQVNEAMAAIGRSTIDGILWHQGESDWIADGTCFTGALCDNTIPDYYAQKLYSRIADRTIPNPVGASALLDRLRAESWFSAGKPFIAGETLQSPVNVHLNKLNSDNDAWTACVSADAESGLRHRANDATRVHYDADSLRILGARYAAEYLKMTSNASGR